MEEEEEKEKEKDQEKNSSTKELTTSKWTYEEEKNWVVRTTLLEEMNAELKLDMTALQARCLAEREAREVMERTQKEEEMKREKERERMLSVMRKKERLLRESKKREEVLVTRAEAEERGGGSQEGKVSRRRMVIRVRELENAVVVLTRNRDQWREHSETTPGSVVEVVRCQEMVRHEKMLFFFMFLFFQSQLQNSTPKLLTLDLLRKIEHFIFFPTIHCFFFLSFRY